MPNPDSKPIVNHKSGDRGDNSAENLEWVTHKENSQKMVFSNRGRNTRSVVEMTADGRFIKVWASISKASEALGIGAGNIPTCCRGRLKTVGGKKWAYLDDYTPQDPGEIWVETPKKLAAAVSSLGRIKTHRTGAITRGSINGGYYTYGGALVHRMVAAAFHPKSDGKDVVNHKDGNTENNAADNLEWVTQQENSQHALSSGLCDYQHGKLSKAVRCIETGKIYVSVAEAHRQTGISAGNISAACRGERQQASGFRWEYVEDPVDEMVAFLDSVLENASTQSEPAEIPDDDPLWEELGLSP